MVNEVLFPHQKLQTKIEPIDFSGYEFGPVMNLPGKVNEIQLTNGYDPEKIKASMPAVGGYNEKRNSMYISPIYKNGRNIHMGFDIWMPAGEDVFSFYDGYILFARDNDNPLDYGPTIVTEHKLGKRNLYALFGHMSRQSLEGLDSGQEITKGQKIGELGDEHENGGWLPHLHLQLSYIRPDEADMPGVVSEQDRQVALQCYPDPENIIKY